MVVLLQTFDYVGMIPVGSLPWAMELQTDPRRSPAWESLFGPRASLEVAEAGVPPRESDAKFRPAVLRARLSLRPSGEFRYGERTGHFHLDLALIKALKPGDTMHLSRTGNGALGVSALRNSQLVFAVGAVTSVPLGEGVSARIPHDLIAELEGVIKRRDPSFRDLPWPSPLEVTVGSETLIFAAPGSRSTVTGFEVTVFRMFVPDEDADAAESVAISRKGLAGSVSANASAQLLHADGLKSGPWETTDEPHEPLRLALRRLAGEAPRVPLTNADVEWTLRHNDTFDHETPASEEERGRGLAAGLTALWREALYEGVGPDGRRTFSNFTLGWREGSASVPTWLAGVAPVLAKLRGWCFPPLRRGVEPFHDATQDGCRTSPHGCDYHVLRGLAAMHIRLGSAEAVLEAVAAFDEARQIAEQT
jgi:hypothetical protein